MNTTHQMNGQRHETANTLQCIFIFYILTLASSLVSVAPITPDERGNKSSVAVIASSSGSVAPLIPARTVNIENERGIKSFVAAMTSSLSGSVTPLTTACIDDIADGCGIKSFVAVLASSASGSVASKSSVIDSSMVGPNVPLHPSQTPSVYALPAALKADTFHGHINIEQGQLLLIYSGDTANTRGELYPIATTSGALFQAVLSMARMPTENDDNNNNNNNTLMASSMALIYSISSRAAVASSNAAVASVYYGNIANERGISYPTTTLSDTPEISSVYCHVYANSSGASTAQSNAPTVASICYIDIIDTYNDNSIALQMNTLSSLAFDSSIGIGCTGDINIDAISSDYDSMTSQLDNNNIAHAKMRAENNKLDASYLTFAAPCVASLTSVAYLLCEKDEVAHGYQAMVQSLKDEPAGEPDSRLKDNNNTHGALLYDSHSIFFKFLLVLCAFE